MDATRFTSQANEMSQQLGVDDKHVTTPEMTVVNELPSVERNEIHKPNSPLATESHQRMFQSSQDMDNADNMKTIYAKFAAEVQEFGQAIRAQTSFSTMDSNLQNLHDSLIHAMRSEELVLYGIHLVQKCVEGLQYGLMSIKHDSEDLVIRYKDIYIRILKALKDPRALGGLATIMKVTHLLTECGDSVRYNMEIVDTLTRAGLVCVSQYDLGFVQYMDNGSNDVAVIFATRLIELFLIKNNFVSKSEFANIIEILTKVVASLEQPPEAVASVIDFLRQDNNKSISPENWVPTDSSVFIRDDVLKVKSLNDGDLPGIVNKTYYLLGDWIGIYHLDPTNENSNVAFSLLVHRMHVYGMLQTDDLITRFLRISTQLFIEAVYRNITHINSNMMDARVKCYHILDLFVRLVLLLVKHAGDLNNTPKIYLLSKVLGIVARCLLQDHEQRQLRFHQLPYHRIFIMLFLELCSGEPSFESINFQALEIYCCTLHTVRPSKAAGFCYAWLELISYPVFIKRMMEHMPQQKGRFMYAHLLIDLFKYLAPFLSNVILAEPLAVFYRGALRVILVLFHDFPELFCDYYYDFCNVIPPNCIQMRNLILSASPRNMNLPNPFKLNLKLDVSKELTCSPKVIINFASLITPPKFKKRIDSYLRGRQPVTFLCKLKDKLQISNEPGMQYNIPLMNAVVTYVGMQAVKYIRRHNLWSSMWRIAHTAYMDIFQYLAINLDTEGRYVFLNAIANQLRYPNTHTHFFSGTMLHLFSKFNTDATKEQITRVLLERLMVTSPYPWGLSATFCKLIGNPYYNFWMHEFVHCAPEIKLLIECVNNTLHESDENSASRRKW